MFGFFEAIYSFLQRQIGLRTDAASSSGSLHAKATAAATLPVYNWGNTTPKSWSARHTYITAETTIISISGKGFVTSYGAINESTGDPTSATATIKLYIDGTCVESKTFTVPGSSVASNENNNLIWRFKNSFSVSIAASGTSITGAIYAKGFLD